MMVQSRNQEGVICRHLTVTVNFEVNKSKKYIFANFDGINKQILVQNEEIIWQKVKMKS